MPVSVSEISLPVSQKVRAIEALNGKVLIGGGDRGGKGFVLETDASFNNVKVLSNTLKYPVHNIAYDHFRYVFTAEDVEIYYSVDLQDFSTHWYKQVNWVLDHNKQPSRKLEKAPDGTGYYLVSGGELQFGLIQHSPDSFASWVPQEYDNELRAVCFSPSGVGLAGGNGILLRKEKGETNWTRQRLNGQFITDMVFVNEQHVAVALFDGGFLYSNNGGNSFQKAKVSGQTLGNPLFASKIAVVGNNKLIAVGAKGSVFLSTDNGKSWKGERKVNENLESIYVLNQSQVVVGGSNGKLFRFAL